MWFIILQKPHVQENVGRLFYSAKSTCGEYFGNFSWHFLMKFTPFFRNHINFSTKIVSEYGCYVDALVMHNVIICVINCAKKSKNDRKVVILSHNFSLHDLMILKLGMFLKSMANYVDALVIHSLPYYTKCMIYSK